MSINNGKPIMNGRYVCFIELFDEGNYNYIQCANDEGGFTLCVDFENFAKHFETTDDAIMWAKAHGLKDGEFGVKYYWIEERL